jgi:hypothetical protein
MEQIPLITDQKAPFTLTRNTWGRLQLNTADGTIHDGVYPVRAFPISAADEGLSVVSADSHELLWIERLSDLDADSRKLLAAELAQREFMPEIQSIHQVSSFATPCTWQVTTDRGDAELVLKAEDHIRRLTQTSLLITDGHGINFLIRDLEQLDKHSRKLLDRFL